MLPAILRNFLTPTLDCLNNAYFDFNSHSTVEGLGESDYLDLYNAPSPRDVPVEHPCLALQKLLSDGTFYYSVDFDLTNRLQTRSGIPSC